MKLQTIRLSNFQSFGEAPTDIRLEEITYLIGPNGSGKTAALQALCRLFAFDPSLRRILRSDFHVPFNEEAPPAERQLWLEAEFLFPELGGDEDNSTIAPHFGHMRLDEVDGTPRVISPHRYHGLRWGHRREHGLCTGHQRRWFANDYCSSPPI